MAWVEAEPVVPAVQLQEGVNNFSEDTTFTFTAPANGTLKLTVNTASMFTTPGTIADASYSVNGGELIEMTRGTAVEIVLNAGDEVIVEGYATAAAKLTVVWTATPAACQHTNTKVEGAVEATCTAAGFTGNTVCADCGEQIAAGTEIAALGHAFVDGTCAACGAADPDYVKPVVNLTIGQNPINNEEITYTYTAAADGTLNLSLSISAMAIRDHLNLSYSINGGEAAVLASGRVANVNQDIALNKNDVIEITIETNLQTALVATWTEKVVENKTITIGDKTFTTVDGKWAFNQEMTAASSTGYNMIIMTKAFTGSFVTNGYGVAIVLDQYGTLVRVYDGANVGYWTVDGKAASAHFGANDYAITAWNELQEGETLVVFTHTGSEGNVARQFGLNVRSLCGQTATLTGFEFAAAPCKHTNTKVEGAVEATCEEKGYTGNTVCADCGETVAEGTEIAALGHNYVDGVCANCNNPKTFDVFGIMVAVMAASGTALVCLKKKED
jgi:hypothetical protein